MRRRTVWLISAACVCLLAIPSAARAQSAIAGVAKDDSGAVLPGVTVEASSDVLIEKTRTVVTDGSGLYKIIDLRPGTYLITFSLTGFQTFKRDGLELPGGFTANVDAVMKVGSLEESVTVSGASPVVDVSSNTKSSVLPRDVLDAVPNAHTIQSIGQLIPGVTLTSPDVGGSAQMQQTYFSVHGFGAAGTTLLMDGMVVNTLGSDGAIQNYLSTAGNAEMVYQTGGGGGESLTGGLNINMVPREGGNRFSGTSSLGLERWQSDNFGQELKNQGVTNTDQLGKYYDWDATLGGPIKKDRMWFFLTGRLSHEEKPIANSTNSALFGANPMTDALLQDSGGSALALAACRTEAAAAALAGRDSGCPVGFSPETINSALGRGTLQVTSKIKFQFAYDKISKERFAAQGSGDDQRVTAIHWTSPNYSTQTAKLTATLTNRLLLEGGWSAAIERYNTYYEDGIEQRYYTPLWYSMVARNNTTDSVYSVAPSGMGRTYPDRYNWQGSASYVTGSHNIKLGFVDSFGTFVRGAYRNGDMISQFQTVSGVPNVPYQVGLYATDPRNNQRLNAMMNFYAQDSWTHKRVTLTAGLRWDYVDQEVLGIQAQQGTFEVVPAFGNIDMPHQKNWSERISGVVDVFGNGKTALRAGFNKVPASSTEGLATGQNPGGGNSANVAWTDANGDNIPQYYGIQLSQNGGMTSYCVYKTPGCELDFSKLASNFGGIQINNTLDPNLGRPYYIQTNIGVSQELMKGVSLTVEWFRTDNKNIQATNNLTRVVDGLTDLSQNPNYTPFTVFSPVDGHAITMYDVASTAVSNAVARNFTFTDKNRTQVYNGFDIGFNARLPRGGRVFGGTTTERSQSFSCDSAVDNPNNIRYCDTKNLEDGYTIPWKTQIKLAATYPLPWFGVSVNASYQGLPGYTEGQSTYSVTKTTKNLTCPGNSAAAGCVVNGVINANLIASSVSVPLDPTNVTLTPRTNQLDFGMSKRFKIGRIRFDPKIDLFNALNSDAFYSVRSTTFSPRLDPNATDPTHVAALPSLAAGSQYTNFRAPARFLQGRLIRIGFNLAW